MGLALTQVDAFTDRAFTGNPAAVCLLDEPRDDSWMQLVAREMNLSETAFLLRREDAFDLRWFTPTVEVDLCGHATLASARTVLWEEGHLGSDQPARFHTRSGLLTAEKKGSWIEMNFPATPPQPSPRLEVLESALGVTAKFTGRPRFDYLVEVESEEVVRAMKPDFPALRALKVRGGLIVTSRASASGYDFVSRFFFAPGSGIDEEPGHRLGSLLFGSILERASGQGWPGRIPGVGARWLCPYTMRWRSSAVVRSGRHYIARGIGLNKRIEVPAIQFGAGLSSPF